MADFADSILKGAESGIGLAQKVEALQEQRRLVDEQKKELQLKRSDMLMNKLYKAATAPESIRDASFDNVIADSEVVGQPFNPETIKALKSPEFRTQFLQAAAGIAGLPDDIRGQAQVGVMTQLSKPDMSDLSENLIKMNEALSKRAVAMAKEKPKEATALQPDKVIHITEMSQIPRRITELKDTIEANKEKFGYVKGKVGVANPSDTKAQLINAQIRDLRQSIGRLKEGGVLRKEDEEKYAEILAQLQDNPTVATGKLDLISRDMALTYNDTIKNLKTSGYNTSAFAEIKNVNPKIAILGDKKQTDVASGMGQSPQMPEAIRKKFEAAGLKPGTPKFQSAFDAYKKKVSGAQTAAVSTPALPAAGLSAPPISEEPVLPGGQ